MLYSSIIIATLATSIIAFPTVEKRSVTRRALGPKTYNEISIAGGVAGKCEEEALAVFSSLNLDDLSTVDAADLAFLDNANAVANQAEREAFNPAIEAATGEEKVNLQNGKIKNKCFKSVASKIRQQALIAQGDPSRQAKLDLDQTKLDKQIALDAAAAGQPSTAVPFEATI